MFLIQYFNWESLATLCAFVRFFSIVKTFVMLLQVTYFVEHLIAFITPELSVVIVEIFGSFATLWTVSFLLDCCPVGVGVDMLWEDAVEAVLRHRCVG